jgi:acetyl-CoA carboxylase carboxyl transferase subunit beta
MVKDSLRQVRERAAADISNAEEAYVYHRPIPDDLWVKCPECGGVMFCEEFEKEFSVCTKCGHHFRLDSRERIAMVVDEGSFEEMDSRMRSVNPLGFPGYGQKIEKLMLDTGLSEAIVTGEARVGGFACMVGAMDSRFLMGSMGSVVGEKIARMFERATSRKLPVILFAASGGARMQEGIVSLMQMAKTAGAVARHDRAGLLFISVMTDPTTGGVTASFASLGDIILTEPGTLIGFAGRRVIEGTIAEQLPDGFQRAEFLMEHGFIDRIVQRGKMRSTLAQLLAIHCSPAAKRSRRRIRAVAQDYTDITVARIREFFADARHIGLFGVDHDHPTAEGPVTPPPQAPRKASERLDVIRRKNRPTLRDYIPLVFDDFIELHGDRLFADDLAMCGGLAMFQGVPVTVVGHVKGRSLEENSRTNFGMPHPEGYRKAMRLMKQAEKFSRPVLCFVDTTGAYCGVGAEERGQGEAIARNLLEMMDLKTPVVSIVTGEGGSGGALAVAVCDELAMLRNAIYSVISPRGFSSILWKDGTREREAADIMRITGEDLMEFGICDAILPEPDEGAHVDHRATAAGIVDYLSRTLPKLCGRPVADLLEARYEKYRRIGMYLE